MKSTLHISLDSEIIAKLRQEKNYSDLINSEMKAYYNAEKCENITILKQNLAEIKQVLKINGRKKRLIDKKLEKIKTKEQKVIKITSTTRKNLIEKIRLERRDKQFVGRHIRYYISPEEEADRILEGGEK